MMTVTRLFLRRIISEWKYQYQTFRAAVDWTVALYIVIPCLAIFFDYYFSWWRAVPGWLLSLPLNALIGLILVFIWSGTVRIFVEEADQLFLLQRKGWISRIIKYSLGYSVGSNLLSTSFLLIILAPFLFLHYGFSSVEIIWLNFFIVVFKTCVGIVKQLVEHRFKGWTQTIIRAVLFLMTSVFLRESVVFLLTQLDLFYLSGLSLLVALIWLLTLRMNLHGSFYEDIFREKTAKLRLTKFMLQRAGVYVKKPIRQRPLLFRNSNLLFKNRNPMNGLVEMCLKSELRNDKDVKFYIEKVGLSLLAILLFPPDYGWLLWLVFSIMITNFVLLFWQDAIKDPFVCLFPWLPETKIVAMRKAIFLMALPGQLILGIVVVVKNHSWLGGLLMVPITVLIGYYIAKRFSTINSGLNFGANFAKKFTKNPNYILERFCAMDMKKTLQFILQLAFMIFIVYSVSKGLNK